MDAYKIANELVRISSFKTREELQSIVNSKKNPYYAIISLEADIVLIFEGIELLSMYEYVKNYFYHINTDILNTISLKNFIRELDNILFESKKTSNEITPETIKNIINSFLEKPISSFLIIKGIHGIKLNNTGNKLVLGPFVIYHQPFYKEITKKDYPDTNDFLWHDWEHEYLVTININARSKDKAYELADEMLYQLELFIYFSIGHYKKEFCINIISQMTYKFKSYLLLEKDTFGFNFSREIVENVPLDDPYFTDNNNGNDKIWNLLFKRKKTAMEKRIITSIEWIGKANSEMNNINRFLFYVIAIESLLTFQEKTMITPSIANSISESIAMILGSNYEDRIIIEKQVKEIYSIRSAITHGNDKLVSDEEMNIVMDISRYVLRAFLTNNNLSKIQNIEQFIEYLKKEKYR